MKNLLILLLVAVVGLSLNSCEETIEGEGEIVSVTLTVLPFDKVNLNSSFDIVLQQGSTQSVVAEGQQNIIDRIQTTVNDQEWDASLEDGNYSSFDLTVYITVPDLESVKVSGSGDVTIATFITTNLAVNINGSGDITATDSLFLAEDLALTIEGSGDISVGYLEATDLTAKIAGSGSISAEGSVVEETLKVEGSGDITIFGVISLNATATIEGSGDIELFAQDVLNYQVEGSGNIYYQGNPVLNGSVNGSGDLFDAN